MRVSDRVL